MSAEEIRAVVRRFFEEYYRGKAAAMVAMDELCATDVVIHGGTGEDIRGLKDFKQSVSEFFGGFSDNHYIIDDMVVEGDKVAVRFTWTGTHKGEFMSIPPTNKKVTIWGIYIDRIAGGKIVEAWERIDTLGLMQQLGLVPTPGNPKNRPEKRRNQRTIDQNEPR